MKLIKLSGVILASTLAAQAMAAPITLLQTSSAGYYNNSIGTVLNGTNGGETGPFPVSNDSSLSFPTAPDLSAASGALGNWLTNPGSLNANWNLVGSIPTSWTVGTEVGVIYKLTGPAYNNVIASFGVDNGISVWLNGNYLGGARRAGGAFLGEDVFNLGNLSAGTNYLQLLLEDHGGATGFAIQVTGEVAPAPEPSALLMMAMGAGLLGASRKRRA